MDNILYLLCCSLFYFGSMISYNLSIPTTIENIFCIYSHSNFRFCLFYFFLLHYHGTDSIIIKFRFLQWIVMTPLLAWQLCLLFECPHNECFWKVLIYHYAALLSIILSIQVDPNLQKVLFLVSLGFFSQSMDTLICDKMLVSLWLSTIHYYFKLVHFCFAMISLIESNETKMILYSGVDIYLYFIPIFF